MTSPSGDPVVLVTPRDSINAPVPSGGYLSVLKYFHVDETGEYHVLATVGDAAPARSWASGSTTSRT